MNRSQQGSYVSNSNREEKVSLDDVMFPSHTRTVSQQYTQPETKSTITTVQRRQKSDRHPPLRKTTRSGTAVFLHARKDSN
jgi:hypothetical protein